MKLLVTAMKTPHEGKVYNIDTGTWIQRNLDCDIICSAETHKINEFTRAYAALVKLQNIIDRLHLNKYNQKIKEKYEQIKVEHPGLVEIIELTFPEEDYVSKVVEYVPTFSKIVKRRGIMVPKFDLDSQTEIAGLEAEAPNLISSNPQKTLVYNQLYRNYYKWEHLRFRRDFTYNEVKYLLHLPEDFDVFTEMLSKDEKYKQFQKFKLMIDGDVESKSAIDMSIVDTRFWITRLLWNEPNATELVPFVEALFAKISHRLSKFHRYDIKNDKWIQGDSWDQLVIKGNTTSDDDFYNRLYAQYLLIVDELYRLKSM
jgi:hypothetical protein